MKRSLVAPVGVLIALSLAWIYWVDPRPAVAPGFGGAVTDRNAADGPRVGELEDPDTNPRSPASEPSILDPVPESATPEVESPPAIEVEGRVVDSEGLPYGGVSVWAEGPDPRFMGPSTSTDADGVYRLEIEPGPNELKAKVQGTRTTREAFDVPAGIRRAHGPTLVLEDAGMIEGVVVDSHGVGVAGIPVDGHSSESELFSTMAGGRRLTWGGDSTVTDHGGRFVLRGLEDELHVVSVGLAYRPGWSTERGTISDVRPGGDSVRFELEMEDRLDVALFDARSSAPVTRAEFDGVLMFAESGGKTPIDGVHLWSESGVYSIRVTDGFRVSSREYESIDVVAPSRDARGTEPLQVALTPKEFSSWLTLRVRTDSGAPACGLVAEGWTQDGQGWQDTEDGVSPMGELRIGGLEEGEHRIRLTGLGIVPKTVDARVDERGHGFEEVLVESGWPVPIRFVDGGGRLAHGIELRVTHESGATPPFEWRYERPQGITITIDRDHAHAGGSLTVKEGEGTLAGLAAGHYRLETRWGDGPWRSHPVEVGESSAIPREILP